MLFDEYSKKIKKIAKVKNGVYRFRILILTVTAALVAFGSTYLFGKGTPGSVSVPTEIVYGEALEVDGSALFAKVEYEYQLKGTDTWTTEMPTEAGEYLVRIKSMGSFGPKYSKAEEFIIKKRDLKITLGTSTVYGSAPSVNPDGLATGDKIDSVSLLYDYKDLTKTETQVALVKDSIHILNNLGTDVTTSYNITNEYADISFTKYNASISILSEDKLQKTYDGLAYDVDASLYDVGELPFGDELKITGITLYNKNNEIIDEAILPGKYSFKVTSYSFMNGANDTSANYQTEFNTLIGSFTINERPIIVKTGTDSKKYDGTALTCDDIDIDTTSPNALLSGHKIVINKDYEQSEILYYGECDNKMSYKIVDSAGNDVSYLYKVTSEIYGKLTINKYDGLTVTSNNASKTYDGLGLTEYGFTYDSTKLITATDVIALDSNTSTITNAGEVDNVFTVKVSNPSLTDEENIKLNESYDIQYAYGKLKVEKKDISITLTADSSTYNGSYVSNNYDNFSITSGTMATGESLAITVKYSKNNTVLDIIDADTYDVTFDTFTVTNGDINNYNVTSTNTSTYTIGKKSITIGLPNSIESVIYDGDTHPYNLGYTINEIDNLYQADETLTLTVSYNNSSDLPKDADTYRIRITDIAKSDLANKNYNVTVDSTDYLDFTIKQRRIEIRANNQAGWTYDGEDTSVHNYVEGYSLYDLDGQTDYSLKTGEAITAISVRYASGTSVLANVIDAGSYKVFVYSAALNALAIKNYSLYFQNKNTTTATLEVAKKNIQIMAENCSTTYNGNNHIYGGIYHLFDENGGMSFYQPSEGINNIVVNYTDTNGITTDNAKNAGTYSISFKSYSLTDTAKNNYNITETEAKATLTINKLELKLAPNNDSWTYDGQFHTYDKGVSIYKTNNSSYTLPQPDEKITITTNYNGTTDLPINADTYTIGISAYQLSPLADQNYSIVDTTATATLTINQKAIVVAANKQASYTYDNTYHAYTEGYKLYADNQPFTFYQASENLSGINILYYSNGSWVSSVKNAGTYNIKVSTYNKSSLANQNYLFTIYNGPNYETLTIEKRKIELRASVDDSFTYNGNSYTYASSNYVIKDLVTGNDISSLLQSGETIYSVSYAFKQSGQSVEAKNAGTYDIYVSSHQASSMATNNYDISYSTSAKKLTINKLTIEISATNIGYTGWTYDGTYHSYNSNNYILKNDGSSFTFYQLGETLTISVKFKDSIGSYSSSIKNAGTYKIYVDSYNASALANQNYIFTKYSGNDAEEVTIYKQDITIKAKNQAGWIYDGNYYSYTEGVSFYVNGMSYTLKQPKLESVTSYTYQYEKSGTLYDSIINGGTYNIYLMTASYSSLFSQNYNPTVYTYSSMNMNPNASVTISKRRIEFRTKDETGWIYDGTTHSVAHGYIIKDLDGNVDYYGLVNPAFESFTLTYQYKYGATVTTPINAGTYTVNVKSVTPVGVYTAQNYEISYPNTNTGKLTITQRELDIRANNQAKWTYDNTYHSYTAGYTLYDLTDNSDDFTFYQSLEEWISVKIYYNNESTLSIKNAGTYKIYVSSSSTISDLALRNYKFSYNTKANESNIAKVTIEKRTIHVYAKAFTYKYDGNTPTYSKTNYILKDNGSAFTFYQSNSEYFNSFTVSYGDLDLGQTAPVYRGEYRVWIIAANSSDLANQNYNFVYQSIGDTTEMLTITPRNIVVTVGSRDTDIYSNNPYYINSFKITENDGKTALSANLYKNNAFVNMSESFTITSYIYDYIKDGNGSYISSTTTSDPTNAGTYTAKKNTISSSSLFDRNYNVSYNTGTLKINKLDVNVSPKNQVVTYSGNVFTYDTANSNKEYVFYSANAAINNTNTLLNAAEVFNIKSIKFKETGTYAGIDAGTYTIQISDVSSSNKLALNNYNFILTNYTSSLTIKKLGITIGINGPLTHTYNGRYYEYNVAANGYKLNGSSKSNISLLNENETITSIEVTKAINAGSYSIKATGITLSERANRNYDVSYDDAAVSLTINKRSITFIANRSDVFKYSGEAQVYTKKYAYFDNVDMKLKTELLQSGEAIDFTYSFAEELIDAGTYYGTITSFTPNALASQNYIIDYSSDDSKPMVVIEKLDVVLEYGDINDITYSHTYYTFDSNSLFTIRSSNKTLDGQTRNYLLSTDEIIKFNSTSVSYSSGATKPINAGSYIIKLDKSSLDSKILKNYDVTIPDINLTILKKKINSVYLSKDIEHVYNGNIPTSASYEYITYVDEDGVHIGEKLFDGTELSVGINVKTKRGLTVTNPDVTTGTTYYNATANGLVTLDNFEIVNVDASKTVKLTIVPYELNITLNNKTGIDSFKANGKNIDTKVLNNYVDFDLTEFPGYKYEITTIQLMTKNADGSFTNIKSAKNPGRYYYTVTGFTITNSSGTIVKNTNFSYEIGNAYFDIANFAVTVAPVNQLDVSYTGNAYEYPASTIIQTGSSKTYGNVSVKSGELFADHMIKLIVEYYQNGYKVEPIHVGTYQMKVVGYQILGDNDQYYDVSLTETTSHVLSIVAANVTIKVENYTSTAYDGTEKESYSRWIDYDLYGDDTISYHAYVDQVLLNAGSYPIKVASGDYVLNGNADDYVLTFTNGKYTIPQAEIRFNIDNQSKDYDGVPYAMPTGSDVEVTQTYNGKAITNIQLKAYYSDTGEEATTMVNSTQYIIKIVGFTVEGEAISSNFKAVLTGGKYTINKISYDIEYVDYETYFTGQEISYVMTDITDGVLVGHKLSVSPNYTQNGVAISGRYPIHAGVYTLMMGDVTEYDENGVEVAYPNYEINVLNTTAKMTILPAEIIVTPGTVDIYYTTENPKSIVGTQVSIVATKGDFTPYILKCDVYYMKDGNIVTPYECGSYEIHIKDNTIAPLVDDVYMSDFIVIDNSGVGTLTIKKFKLNVQIDSLTKTYGSNASINNLVVDDSFKIDITYKYTNLATSLVQSTEPIHVGNYKVDAASYVLYKLSNGIWVKVQPEEMGNYNITFTSGELVIKKKQITINPKEYSKTYDGEELYYSTSDSFVINNGIGTDVITFKTYLTLDGVAFNEAMVHANTYVNNINQLTIAMSETSKGYLSDYDFDYETTDCVISKRLISYVLFQEDSSKDYDGIEFVINQNSYTYGVGSLEPIDGDSISISYKITVEDVEVAKILDVQRKAAVTSSEKNTPIYQRKVIPYNYTIGDIVIDSTKGSLRSDYDFDANTLTYTINPLNIKVKTGSVETTYDGTEVKCLDSFEKISGTLLDNHAFIWDYGIYGDPTTVKTATINSKTGAIEPVKNVVGCFIYDVNTHDDKTQNYIITYDYGTITVHPRKIKIVTGSANKIYDGSPLTCLSATCYKVVDEITGEEISESGLITGYELKITKATVVYNANEGIVENKPINYSILFEGENKTSAFEIIWEYGELYITPIDVYIVVASVPGNVKLYDTKSTFTPTKTINIYKDAACTIPFDKDIIDQSSIKITMVKDGYGNDISIICEDMVAAGEYEVTLTSLVMKTVGGIDTTDNYNVISCVGTANYKIQKRVLYLETATRDKFYDGKDLSDTSVYEYSHEYVDEYGEFKTGLMDNHYAVIDKNTSIESNYVIKGLKSDGSLNVAQQYNKFNIKIVTLDGEDVSDNYEYKKTIHYGTLEIRDYLKLNLDRYYGFTYKGEEFTYEDMFKYRLSYDSVKDKYYVQDVDGDVTVRLYIEDIYDAKELTDISKVSKVLNVGEYYFSYSYEYDLPADSLATEEIVLSAINNCEKCINVSIYKKTIVVRPYEEKFEYDRLDHTPTKWQLFNPSTKTGLYKAYYTIYDATESNNYNINWLPINGHRAVAGISGGLNGMDSPTIRINGSKLTITSFIIYDSEDNDVTSNYEIITNYYDFASSVDWNENTTEKQKETIKKTFDSYMYFTQRSLPYSITGNRQLYDGTSFSYQGYTVDYKYSDGTYVDGYDWANSKLLPGDVVSNVVIKNGTTTFATTTPTMVVTITNSLYGDVTSYYKLEKIKELDTEYDCKLTVEKQMLTITANSYQSQYDGNPLDPSVYEGYTISGLLAGDYVASVTYALRDSRDNTVKGGPVYAGKYTLRVSSLVIKNAAGQNVTSAYDYKTNRVDGTVEITIPFGD